MEGRLSVWKRKKRIKEERFLGEVQQFEARDSVVASKPQNEPLRTL
jgi:hypothetical protein